MKIKTIAISLMLATSLTVTSAYAQSTAQTPPMNPERPLAAADLEGLRVELRSSKKQFIAQNLHLTDAESTKFWPVYDQYAADVTKIKDDYYGLIAEYVNNFGKYDDKSATDFITRWLSVDTRMTALRASYVPIVGRVLPGVKTATFFQIDRRLNLAVDLKLATQLPILQFQNTPAK